MNEQEPVAWITTWNDADSAGVELHWANQDKGETSKHTPLYTEKQMKDIAQKLADSANEAAAELRRLDALNAELVEALYGAVDSLQDYVGMVGDASEEDADNLATALAVLKKAKEQT